MVGYGAVANTYTYMFNFMPNPPQMVTTNSYILRPLPMTVLYIFVFSLNTGLYRKISTSSATFIWSRTPQTCCNIGSNPARVTAEIKNTGERER